MNQQMESQIDEWMGNKWIIDKSNKCYFKVPIDTRTHLSNS